MQKIKNKKLGRDQQRSLKRLWFKTSSRKDKKSKHSKPKNCGEWCLYCGLVTKNWGKRVKKYGKVKNKQLFQAVKADIKNDPEVARKMRANSKEIVIQRAKGKRMCADFKGQVAELEDDIEELEEPESAFYELKAFRSEFGVDAKSVKGLKMKWKRRKGGKRVQGVVVRTGKRGVYNFKQSHRRRVEKSKILHSGDEQIDEHELSDAVAENVSDAEDDGPTVAELRDRISKAKAATASAASTTAPSAAASKVSSDEEDSSNDESEEDSSDGSASTATMAARVKSRPSVKRICSSKPLTDRALDAATPRRSNSPTHSRASSARSTPTPVVKREPEADSDDDNANAQSILKECLIFLKQWRAGAFDSLCG